MEGDARFEFGWELFLEYWSDFWKILDDDFEVGESGCEDGVVVASGSGDLVVISARTELILADTHVNDRDFTGGLPINGIKYDVLGVE